MKVKKIAVIGGDFRNFNLANMLAEDGFIVNTFALSDKDSATLELALNDVDIVVGPIPFSIDRKTVNTPLYNESIPINTFFKIAGEKSIVIAGKFDEAICSRAKYHGIKTIDILERSDFSVLNAIPTAEGAIQIAIQETAYTLNSSNILILGFGRVGRVLIQTLSGFGGKVYVAARSFVDIAYAKAYGINVINYNDLEKEITNMNVIFNTVPAKILDDSILKNVAKEGLIIDLASRPGGVDFDKAKEYGIKTIWALSLPGKVAPETSAKIVRETIFNIIREMEE
jgi:dipicolinate synthase subunit A